MTSPRVRPSPKKTKNELRDSEETANAEKKDAFEILNTNFNQYTWGPRLYRDDERININDIVGVYK